MHHQLLFVTFMESIVHQFKVIVILRNEKIEMLKVSDLIGPCDLPKARPTALHIFHKNDKNSYVSGTEI